MGSRRSLTAKLPSSNSKLCGVSDCSTRPPRMCAIVFMCRVCRSSPSVHLLKFQNYYTSRLLCVLQEHPSRLCTCMFSCADHNAPASFSKSCQTKPCRAITTIRAVAGQVAHKHSHCCT